MKFLKLFQTHQEYSEYLVSSEYLRPNVSHCIQENDVHYTVPIDWSKDYLTFVVKEDAEIEFVPANNNNVISYSTDNGTTWIENNYLFVESGNKVLFKGTMTPTTNKGIGKFSSTGRFDVQGNVMSLLYGDNFTGQTDLTGKNYSFYGLFSGNTNVISAENISLPATTLAERCYNNMFKGCTNLTIAPELPATTLVNSCYWGMFADCASLTTAPELPAITLTNWCYYNMFSGCTSLTVAPELPAMTLGDYCYWGMFSGCTSLTVAPELPATTSKGYCYGAMFADCTSLTTAPELPATALTTTCYHDMFSGCTSLVSAPELSAATLADHCYQRMFAGCTSLTVAPELPATTLVNYCYSYMFSGCTNLNYIKAMFTTTPSITYTNNWVDGVASSGTFVKNSAAIWNVTGVNGVPTGWTVQTAS